jgi:hypothetical protein
MKLLWMLFIVLPLVSSAALTSVQAQTAEPLQFEQFAVSEIYKGTPVAVNLDSHPEARRFRTVLRSGAQEGPNFAGQYTVVMLGCGTSCQSIAIVDAKTGTVYMPGLMAEAGAKYDIDSKLLVVNPPENIVEGYGNTPPEWLQSRYYVWEKNQLVEIRLPRERSRLPEPVKVFH